MVRVLVQRLLHGLERRDGDLDDGGEDHHRQHQDTGKEAGAVRQAEELPDAGDQHHHADEAIDHGGVHT